MLHADDLPEGPLRFVEVKVRLLLPKGSAGGAALLDDAALLDSAVDQDVLSATPIGTPIRCACGWVAINTDGYSWGQAKYRKAIYCPRCDGGEHI